MRPTTNCPTRPARHAKAGIVKNPPLKSSDVRGGKLQKSRLSGLFHSQRQDSSNDGEAEHSPNKLTIARSCSSLAVHHSYRWTSQHEAYCACGERSHPPPRGK